MSMLKERIEVKKPLSEVWQFMDLRRWPEISAIFQQVDSSPEVEMQVGSAFVVTAGPGEAKVKYNAEIVACDQSMGRLVYKRTGGPLPGTSEWVLTSSPNGTRIDYTNYYQHDLNSTVLSSISRAMIRFLNDLRAAVEK